jgi:outer membrane murein-binding lipoprotein Lpp
MNSVSRLAPAVSAPTSLEQEIEITCSAIDSLYAAIDKLEQKLDNLHAEYAANQF